jgi:hypothetical protein
MKAATSVPTEVAPPPLEKLRRFLETHRMKSKTGPRSFAEFERELHERVMEVERDLVAAEMARFDIDADAVVIEGKVHRRVLRQSQTYETTAGEVVVERTLYKDRTDADGRCVSPMELTLGIIGDFWTPRAAQQALWVVTQMTPKKGEELFERVGNMTPSKSSLDRLPKLVAERWEDNREAFERALREGLEIPEGTVSIAVSLDGVLAPIDGGNSPTEVRANAAAEGRMSKGPAGYREASCATVSFCDAKGDLLGAVRMARAPEPKKATLKRMLADEVAAILLVRPELKMVKVADGAADNWVSPARGRVLDEARGMTQTRARAGELSSTTAAVPRRAAARSRIRPGASSRRGRGERGCGPSTSGRARGSEPAASTARRG